MTKETGGQKQQGFQEGEKGVHHNSDNPEGNREQP